MRGTRLMVLLLATGVVTSAATVAIVHFGSSPTIVEVSPTGLQGERGEQGEQGERGEQGLQGERGTQGMRGPIGREGPQGVTGATGQQGISGAQGERGVLGEAGARGESGAQGVQGLPGEQGLRGEQGVAGAQGERGAKGETGDSGVAGAGGLPGETGLAGPPGPQGETGDTGATGATGSKGDPGGFGAHGSFYDRTDVPLTLGQATPVPLGQTDFSSGVSIASGSEITMSVTGRFSVAFSIQLEKTDPGTDWVSIWLRKNGNNVPWSNTDIALVGTDANSRTVAAWNFFVEATTVGDHWQLMIASTTSPTGRMLIQSVDSQTGPARPAIPGTIVTVNQIG